MWNCYEIRRPPQLGYIHSVVAFPYRVYCMPTITDIILHNDYIVTLQVYIHVHWRFIVVEMQVQLVCTSLWTNVTLIMLWIFSRLKLATAWSTILTLIRLSVLGMSVLYQLIYQQGDVTDIVPAASVKRFSSIHKDQSLLYVISVEMETSSESDLHAT